MASYHELQLVLKHVKQLNLLKRNNSTQFQETIQHANLYITLK